MTRFPSVSSRQIIRVLKKRGFSEAPDRGKGSHRAYTAKDASGVIHLVIVPQGKDIPRGTVQEILSQAAISRDEFIALL